MCFYATPSLAVSVMPSVKGVKGRIKKIAKETSHLEEREVTHAAFGEMKRELKKLVFARTITSF